MVKANWGNGSGSGSGRSSIVNVPGILIGNKKKVIETCWQEILTNFQTYNIICT